RKAGDHRRISHQGSRARADTGAVAAVPALEDGAGGRRRGESHRSVLIIGSRTGSPAVDPRGAGSDRAAASARASHRESELRTARSDAEASEHGGVRCESEAAEASARAVAAAPTLEGGAGGWRRREGHRSA